MSEPEDKESELAKVIDLAQWKMRKLHESMTSFDPFNPYQDFDWYGFPTDEDDEYE